MTSVKAAVARKPGAPLSIEELRLEDPRQDEVLVKIASTGICHTDINYRDQVYEIPLPIVLGHEGSGVIEKVGEAVEGFALGDEVILTYGTCGHCHLCRSGNPSYCGEITALNLVGNRPDGTSGYSEGVRSHFFGQSSFATYSLAPAANLVKVPAGAPLELLGTLGCGVQTGAGAVLRSLRVRPGSSVVIFGAGAVGLSALMAAVISGAAPIVVVDRVASRFPLAEELGAAVTIDATKDDPVAGVREITSGGADFTIEAAGSPAAFRQAVDSTGPLGTVGIVGGAGAGVEAAFDWPHVQYNGITIRGVIEGDSIPADFIPELVRYQGEGRLPVEKLATFYEFSEINRAMDEAASGRVVKPILRMPD